MCANPPHTHNYVTCNGIIIYTKTPDWPSGKGIRFNGVVGSIPTSGTFLYKVYLNGNGICLKVLSEPRRVTLPTGNNFEMTYLNLTPSVVFITSDGS